MSFETVRIRPAAATLSPAEIARAVDAIDADGFVVLQAVVPAGPLQRLRRRMDRDSVDLVKFLDTLGGNPRARGHLQQGPPPFASYVLPEVAMNPFVQSVCQAVLGPRPNLTFYNGNTNYPGSEYQHVHMDSPHETEDGSVGPTYALVANIPPGPCSQNNGAIELWPGSHRVFTDPDEGGVTDGALDVQRRIHPPVNPETEVGDILIRDIRLWHRGVPNGSDRPRHMIALVVTTARRDTQRKLKFGPGCEAVLEGQAICANAEYVKGPIDYLFGPSKRIFERNLRKREQAIR